MVNKRVPFFAVALFSAAVACMVERSSAQQQTSQETVASAASASHPTLVLVSQYKDPVITVRSAGAEDNKYGFEDGRVVKIADKYHLITTEMFTEPFSVKTRIGYWTSTDRIRWIRVSTLFFPAETKPVRIRALLYGGRCRFGMKRTGYGNFFTSPIAPSLQTEPRWLLGYEGRIWRAVSQTKGPTGIGGPYKDVGIVLNLDRSPKPGKVYRALILSSLTKVGDIWFGMYGTAHTEKHPVTAWQLGLASAPDLAGPWKRYPQANPLPIEPVFAENPIVTRLDDGTFMAVYDTDNDPNAIGYDLVCRRYSLGTRDNTNRSAKRTGKWANEVITPLGLISEGSDTFTVFYTGRIKPNPIYSESIGFVIVKLEARTDKIQSFSAWEERIVRVRGKLDRCFPLGDDAVVNAADDLETGKRLANFHNVHSRRDFHRPHTGYTAFNK